MREIKFRLIKDGKIVGYERHILNLQCGDNRQNVICIQHSRTGTEYDSNVKDAGWWCIWYDKNYFIDHDTKDQFTGLKDCKRTKEYPEGKEIYGGMEIKGLSRSMCPREIEGVVVWDEVWLGWYVKKGVVQHKLTGHYDIEIIHEAKE